ncbi:amidohydrolase family protein [Tsuneonella dongtanensis]|nr:amidohydrolase family protein [Tsuneonella dongtanensis]
MRSIVAAAILLAGGPLSAREALVGGTIIDGTGRTIENGVVVIDRSRLACVGSATECPLDRKTRRIDVAGKFVTPGLVDAHVHFAQTGWIDGRPDGLEDKAVYPYEATVAALRADPGRWHRSYLCSGVTAVLDTGGAPWTVTGPQTRDTDRSDRAHVRAAGPLITHGGRNEFYAYGSLKDEPMFLPMESAAQVRADVARLKAMGAAAIKVWYLDPPKGREDELDALLMETGAAARAAGLPLIVHATELRNAKMALRAGAHLLVHSVEDAPVDAEFLSLLKANDAAYAPTLVVGRNWSRATLSIATGEAATIDDPNRCADTAIMERIGKPQALHAAFLKDWGGKVTPFARRFEAVGREAYVMAGNLRAVRDAGGRIVLATDAGNPLTLHGPSVNWEMEAMQAAGMTPTEIIVAATGAAARAIGLGEATGTLERGKEADLLVLADDPRKDIKAFRSLTHVMRAGVLKPQSDLRVR